MTLTLKQVFSTSVLVLAVTAGASASERASEAGRRSPLEIERGWIEQQQKFDARLAARGETLAVPGAVISPPLPEFPVFATTAAADVQRSIGPSGPTPGAASRAFEER